MNNMPRPELLMVIAELCRQYPDWRLGQLIANVAGWADQEIWDIDDEQLLAAAKAHLLSQSDKVSADVGEAMPG